MEWTEDEVERGLAAQHRCNGYRRDRVKAIMTVAVELVAARGGTMSALDLTHTLEWVRDHGLAGPADKFSQHIATQGARIAALEEQTRKDATDLHGYTVFVGPCVHGRDPWDRCDECGEETAIHALMKIRTSLEAELALARKGFDPGSPAEATIRALEAARDTLASRCDVLREKSTTTELELQRTRQELEQLRSDYKRAEKRADEAENGADAVADERDALKAELETERRLHDGAHKLFHEEVRLREQDRAELKTMTDLCSGYRKAGALEHERAEKAENALNTATALPLALQEAVSKWLATNNLKPEDVRHGMIPLGAAMRWIERMEKGEAAIERANVMAVQEKQRRERAETHHKAVSAALGQAEARLDAIRRRAAEAGNVERLIAQHGLPAAMRWVVEGECAGNACDGVICGSEPTDVKAGCSVAEALAPIVIDSAIQRRGREQIAVLRRREQRWREAGETSDAYALQQQADLVEYVLTGSRPKHPDPTETEASAGVARELEPKITAYDFAAMSDTPLYPCSDTCTHLDAATPGHRERIAARSAQFATEDDGGALASDEPLPERVKERSGAFADLQESVERRNGMSTDEARAFDAGAEAMRAACWAVTKAWLIARDFHPSDKGWRELQDAIEGATP